MQRLYLFCLIFFTFFSSCSKPADEIVEPQGYIQGYFNSEFVVFDHLGYAGKETGNTYFFDELGSMDAQGLNQVNLIRRGIIPSLGSRECHIYINGTPLDQMVTPMRYDKKAYPQQSSLVLLDRTHQLDTLFSATDRYNYLGVTCADPLQVIVTNRTNDVLKGTFEGQIRTPTGLIMEIKQGEFCLRIDRKKM
ncbi:hypothetical protein [Adhaeribacter radiodurans]|uniref:Uncharacterized protein n=1 Tax=Adhaeribacter radiodurans TaxID=2745197 RepID=A0A7L7L7Q0_9BACT|nr:hypothetical protein [Adhaeribacter radiodurans]QMU28793.1 hypothetical protein HUW48_12430 [Adhaeribacter radiodurans]